MQEWAEVNAIQNQLWSTAKGQGQNAVQMQLTDALMRLGRTLTTLAEENSRGSSGGNVDTTLVRAAQVKHQQGMPIQKIQEIK